MPGTLAYDGLERPPIALTSTRAVSSSTAVHLQPPQAGVGVPVGPGRLGAEAQVGAGTDVGRAALEVVADLGLRREHSRPLGVEGEGERVEVRLDVAGAARVVVVAPGAADGVGALQDQEVVVTRLLQAVGHGQAGEARADDDDVVVGTLLTEGLGAGFALRTCVLAKFHDCKLHYCSMAVTQMPPKAPTRPAPRSRLSSAERREQLLDVTRDLADERGFHEVSIDAVARAAGISRPIVYSHFGDLSGLLHAVVDREGQHAVAQLGALLPTEIGPDPSEQLLGALRAFLEAVQAEPIRWRLILMPPEGAPEILRERFERERANVTAQLAAVVGPALAASGGEPAPDPELLARTLQAIAEELARVTLSDPERYPVERSLDYARWALRVFATEGL